MPQSSAARLALLAAALVAFVGVFAGASAGSTKQPGVTAPRLIAHDTKATRTLFSTVVNPLQNFTAPASLSGGAPGGSFISGDIGRTEYLEAVNGNFAIYSRVGGYLASISDRSFWSGIGGSSAAGACATGPVGQPVVAYDRTADRWIVSEAATSGNSWVQCFALSTSGNASGTWQRYVFQVSTSVRPDMPSIGVWPDGYYLAFNQKKTSDSSWAGAGALVVDRQAMLAHPGTAPTARYFDLSTITPGLGGMRVASQQSPTGPSSGAPALYAQMYDDPLDANDRLELWAFHVDWPSPASGSTFTRLASLPVQSFTTDRGDIAFSDAAASPPFNYTLPQLGGELEYYNNGGGTQTLTVTDVADANQLAWYRLTNSGSGWSVANHGPLPVTSVADAPVAAFDGTSVAVGFADPTTSQLFYADASDTAAARQSVGSGSGADNMALTIDPLDNCNFWFSGPRVAAFSFSSCSNVTSAAPELTADPTWSPGLVQEGTTTAPASAGAFSNAATTQNQWLRCDLNGLNCVGIAGANALTYVPVAADADGTHTLRFAETATNSNGSSTAISSPAASIESLPPVNTTAPVISGTAETGATLSVDNGAWTSSSPLLFTYRWQRCNGTTCSYIDGATSSTYVPTSGDVGSTLDVVVSGTNTGGGADVKAAATAAVIVAPPGSTTGTTTGTTTGGTTTGGTTGTTTTTTTPSTGGSGSSTSNPPDLKLTVTSGGTIAAGQRATLYYTVTDKNAQPARNLKVTLTLPSGLVYAGAYAERGPGCVATGSKVVCSLDYVSALTPVTRVQVYLTVNDSGAQTVSATATSTESDTNPLDNTVSISLGSGSATSSSVIGSTAPAPILGPDGMPVGLNGTSAKVLAGTDAHAPTAKALSSTGRVGKTAALKFRISDDSGVARAAATVEHNGRKVTSLQTGFGPVTAGGVYYFAWHVPAHAAKGKYSFCVVASDRSKHSSKQSCAPLSVR